MMKPKLGIIVFARMSSHRLPGKVLMDFGGRPLLAHILARAAALAQPVFVATSDQPEDAAVAAFAKDCGAFAFRGSLDDVLQRAVDCADEFGLDAFARLCGDRPYFPQDQMREALVVMAESFKNERPADLITNNIPCSSPPGLSTEVVRVGALRRVLHGDATSRHREHLTAFLYDHPEVFDIRPIAADFSTARAHTFAVDTPDDYARLSRVAWALADIHATCDAAAASLVAQHQFQAS